MVSLVISRTKSLTRLFARVAVDCGFLFVISVLASPAQQRQATPAQTPASPTAPLTLEEVLARAKANEPSFANAVAADRVAALNRSIARAALLPNVVYHNQYLYTQPNGEIVQGGTAGAQPAPRFIANNTVREYMSQGDLLTRKPRSHRPGRGIKIAGDHLLEHLPAVATEQNFIPRSAVAHLGWTIMDPDLVG